MAQGWPRTLEIDGMDCIQQPGRQGIETWCRKGDAPPVRIEMENESAPSLGLRPAGPAQGWAPSPHAAATRAAARDRTGGYFMGGFGLGVLLGPIGWLIGGMNATSSNVVIPAADPRWTPQQQTQFAMSYANEVRKRRTNAAVLDGITGSAVLTTVALLLASGSGD